jgi:hypothetical protein
MNIQESDIVRMARDAGINNDCDGIWCNADQLQRFAELVAAHEREKCAKFCETNQVWVGQGKRGFSKWGEEDFVAGGRHQGMDYADAIRARSKA